MEFMLRPLAAHRKVPRDPYALQVGWGTSVCSKHYYVVSMGTKDGDESGRCCSVEMVVPIGPPGLPVCTGTAPALRTGTVYTVIFMLLVHYWLRTLLGLVFTRAPVERAARLAPSVGSKDGEQQGALSTIAMVVPIAPPRSSSLPWHSSRPP